MNIPCCKDWRSQMKRLSRKKIFLKYGTTLPDILARSTCRFYKKARIALSVVFPLKDYEKCLLDEMDWNDDISNAMPLGYNFSTKENEESYLDLKYLDFYDYLPKENLHIFKRELKQCVAKNKLAPFASFRTSKDIDKIDNMGRYFDQMAFSNILVAEFCHNEYLRQYSSQVSISLRNLSTSFLVIKYRFYISKKFNDQINAICKTEFFPFTDISRQFNTPWYRPWKFGKAIYTGNNAREKKLYMLITELKWEAFTELRHYFTIYFEHNQMFPPTFETYSTNIRPSNAEENKGFWNSVMLGYHPDYAPEYNACVSFEYKHSQNEGMRCAAYCGGNYSASNCLPEIAQYDIANIYAVYMVASSINRVAKRDIALCNKRISKVIRKSKIGPILKTRVDVEKKLYYSYRFISEFTGDTIDYDDVKAFRSQLYKHNSVSENRLKNISNNTAETKKQIDILLKMLNDIAEYGSAKSNMTLQWLMMIITVLSLVVAIIATIGFEKIGFNTLWDTVSGFF